MVVKDRNPSPADSPYRKRPHNGTEDYDKVDSRFKRQAITQTDDLPIDIDHKDYNKTHRKLTPTKENSRHNKKHSEKPNDHNTLIDNMHFPRDKSQDSLNPKDDGKSSPYHSTQYVYSEVVDYADENRLLHDQSQYRDEHRKNGVDSQYKNNHRFRNDTRSNDDVRLVDDIRSSRDYSNIETIRSHPDYHIPPPNTPEAYSSRPQKRSSSSNSHSRSGSRLITIRCLITTKEAGAIIGKHGKNIADLRENSGAKVMISEQVQGALDRILTIVGSTSTISRVISSVSQIIIGEAHTDDSSSIKPASKNAIIKLLVPHIKMGVVIGKSGSRIREIQEQSSARIIAGEEILPHSTERIVTVIGTPESIQIAIYNTIITLNDFSGDEFKFVPYRPLPVNNNIYLRMPSRCGPSTTNSSYGKQNASFSMQSSCPERMQNYYNKLDTPHHSYQVPRFQMPQNSPHSNPYNSIQLQQIFIPNEMVGSIIGKQGCKINEIRQLSGCHIKIAEARRASSDRLVTIVGSAEENQMALFLLYDRLENEKSRIDNINNPATTTRT